MKNKPGLSMANRELKCLPEAGIFFLKRRANRTVSQQKRAARFIAANYGVRDKDFFMYRLAYYFSQHLKILISLLMKYF